MSEERRQKIADKVRKLLALSTSSNVHEAERAAALAAELMARHQLSEALIATDAAEPEPMTESVVETHGRIVSWKATLLGGVARSAGCQLYTRRSRAGVEYRLVGKASDIDAASYVYMYLMRQIEGLVLIERRRQQEDPALALWSRHEINSFRVGVAATVRERLIAARRQTFEEARAHPESSRALARIDRDVAALRAYMEGLGLRMGRPAQVSSLSAYQHGRQAGHRISLGGAAAGAIAAGPRRLPGSSGDPS